MSQSAWCIAIDSDKKVLIDASPVAYDAGSTIYDLKVKVKQLVDECLGPQVFANPSRIAVFRTSNIDMTNFVMGTALSENDLKHVPPNRLVKEVVSGTEFLIFQDCAPQTSVKRARAQSVSTNDFSVLKRSKIVTLAPSTAGQTSIYEAIQNNPNERVLDDRPRPDAKVAPISLLYRPYGEFQDILTSGMPPKDIAVDLFEMEANVNNLTTMMSLYYSKDYERRDAAIACLQRMFKFEIWSGAFDDVLTDGHSHVDGLIASIKVTKNEVTGISALPNIQCVSYVARSHAVKEEVANLCSRYRIPCLGMSFVGDGVQFHAILLLGHQYRVVGLTPTFSCSLALSNMIHRKQVFHAFIAAHVLQQRIHQDLKLYLQTNLAARPPFLRNECFFPEVTQLRQDGHDDTCIQFRIVDYFASSGDKDYENRRLYHAQIDQPDHADHLKNILVKFSQSYSIELHKFCSEQGHAPRVLGFEQLPGGWFGLAMEYLEDAEPIDRRLSPDQDELLQNLVKDFHAEGLVHGDLRAANILCNEEGTNFWLIDFDWGGKAGEVEYPTWLLTDELRRGRQLKDLKIWQQDDDRVLHNTLQQLRSE